MHSPVSLIKKTASLVILCAVLGCGAKKYKVDYNVDVNFASLQTYQWSDSAEILDAAHTEIYNEIKANIKSALLLKKLIPSDEGSPDFLLDYQVVLVDPVSKDTVKENKGFALFWEEASSVGYMQNFKKGTLVITFLDPQSKRLIWRGTARAAIQVDKPKAKRIHSIKNAVEKILKQFPPA